jgi:hypothetical protein
VRAAGFAVLTLVVACGSSAEDTPQAPAPSDVPPACTTCAETEPPDSCAPGQAPLPAGCAPVGPAACASGFAPHESGFGCVPVLPEAACAGATKATLGSTSCTPVGDCDAPFPPPDATVFVDASGSGAPHYATIETAIAAAPAGAVIAIADGTYDEALGITHPVTLVGRCAARAMVATSSTSPVLNTSAAVTVRGVTLRGGAGVTTTAALSLDAVVVEGGVGRGVLGRAAHVTIGRSVIRNVAAGANGYGQALYTEQGGVVDVDDTEITSVVGRGGVAFDAGSKLALHRSVVRAISVATDGGLGGGLTAYQGAEISLVESAIDRTNVTSIALAHAAKGATVQRSTLSRVAKMASAPYTGAAIDTGEGASVSLEDATLADIESVGVAASDAGTTVHAVRTAFVEMKPGGDIGFGDAIVGLSGAAFTLEGSVVLGVHGLALQVEDAGSKLDVRGSYVAHTASGANGDGGYAAVATHGASLSFDASTLEDSGQIGIVVRDAASTATLSGSLLRGIRPTASGEYGIGMFVSAGATASVSTSTVRGAKSVAVFTSAAGARVVGSILRKNTIALHAQDGSNVVTIDDDAAPITPLDLAVGSSVRFEANETNTGGGSLPVPTVPIP